MTDDNADYDLFEHKYPMPEPHVFLQCNSEYWARMLFVKRSVLEYDQTCFTESMEMVLTMSIENMGQRIEESYCVEYDIWISFKLHVSLEFVTKRNSDSWKICISQSIVWNVIEFTRDCLKTNNAEYFNGDTSREYNAPLFFLDIKIEWNWELLRQQPTSHEFQAFLNVLLHRFQSGFRKFHSTETALLSA